MILKVLEKNKGVLLFMVMLIVFTYIASARVERLEKNNEPNHDQLVYNR